MNKKIVLISAGIVVALPVAYWLISPLWRTVELNESLPTSVTADQIKDNVSAMDEATKSDFENETMKMKDDVMQKSDEMPSNQPIVTHRANLVARAHDVEGEALFVRAGSETFLRFENLKTINGPDLRIYLSAGLNADDIVDLGAIRATDGSVNYPIPPGTDLNKYKNVMIWCRAFGVLFSYAQL